MPNHVKNILTIKGTVKEVNAFVNAITREEIENGESQRIVDFNTLIPMPETLHVCSGGPSDMCCRVYIKNLFKTNKKEYHELYKTIKEYNSKQNWEHEKMELELLTDEDEEEEVARLLKDYSKSEKRWDENDPVFETKDDIINYGSKIATNIKLYGCKDWYNWCINNWGTKWNAYDQRHCYTERDNIATYELIFCTAWGIPDKFYEKMYDLVHEKYPNLSVRIKYANEDIGSCMGDIIDINTKTCKATCCFYDYEEDEESAEDFYNEVWNY